MDLDYSLVNIDNFPHIAKGTKMFSGAEKLLRPGLEQDLSPSSRESK